MTATVPVGWEERNTAKQCQHRQPVLLVIFSLHTYISIYMYGSMFGTSLIKYSCPPFSVDLTSSRPYVQEDQNYS
jgi:hypothetical protein